MIISFWEGFLAGVTIASLITLFLVPKVRELSKLREIYIAPFRKWCGDTCGELLEFYKRYSEEKERRAPYPQKHPSLVERRWKRSHSQTPLLLIIDFKALHDVLEHAPRWLSKIENDENEIAEKFWKLISDVDNSWHSLQCKYPVLASSRNFLTLISNLIDQGGFDNIADEIWEDHVEKNLNCDDFYKIIDFMKGQIP
jgi:hypothetical protein